MRRTGMVVMYRQDREEGTISHLQADRRFVNFLFSRADCDFEPTGGCKVQFLIKSGRAVLVRVDHVAMTLETLAGR